MSLSRDFFIVLMLVLLAHHTLPITDSNLLLSWTRRLKLRTLMVLDIQVQYLPLPYVSHRSMHHVNIVRTASVHQTVATLHSVYDS